MHTIESNQRQFQVTFSIIIMCTYLIRKIVTSCSFVLLYGVYIGIKMADLIPVNENTIVEISLILSEEKSPVIFEKVCPHSVKI